MPRRYCIYCGRVAHRCPCDDPASDLQQFFARGEQQPAPDHWSKTPYKRGVPPQIKRRERYSLRKHYDRWYGQLVDQYGERCLNCGADDASPVIDHVISIARGGLSELDNLQLLCPECNRIKGKLCIDCRQ